MTQEPKPEHPHSRKERHPNWGGRRLGASAPGGNMNGLKTCPERARGAYEGTAAPPERK